MGMIANWLNDPGRAAATAPTAKDKWNEQNGIDHFSRQAEFVAAENAKNRAHELNMQTNNWQGIHAAMGIQNSADAQARNDNFQNGLATISHLASVGGEGTTYSNSADGSMSFKMGAAPHQTLAGQGAANVVSQEASSAPKEQVAPTEPSTPSLADQIRAGVPSAGYSARSSLIGSMQSMPSLSSPSVPEAAQNIVKPSFGGAAR